MPEASEQAVRDPVAVALGEAMRRLRQDLGISQDELGKGCSPAMSVAMISSFERGRKHPRKATLAKIIDGFRRNGAADDRLEDLRRIWRGDISNPQDALTPNTDGTGESAPVASDPVVPKDGEPSLHADPAGGHLLRLPASVPGDVVLRLLAEARRAWIAATKGEKGSD